MQRESGEFLWVGGNILRVRSRGRALALHKLGNLDGNASASCLEVLTCIFCTHAGTSRINI